MISNEVRRNRSSRLCSLVLALLVLALLAGSAVAMHAQQTDTALYAGMRWRSIGPFRAGRVSAVAGIPGNSAIYYMASPGGGVWKTVDGGVVWKPIFDSVPVASIGAMVVSPSNPDIIYVGTGDVSLVGGAVNSGNGIYKSTDAGATWTHIGLDDTEHIGAMWIDPTNPDVVVVAALGKTFSPNPERGIFKTTDGGKSWRKVLYKDEETGGIDVTFDATNPKIGYATLWHHYVSPGKTEDLIGGTHGGAVYKTTDGGDSWTPITGSGFPTGNLGRIGVATAMGGQRVYAIVSGERGEGGFYRSDDGGATWTKSTSDSRVVGNGYFSRVFIDPKNPDILYVAQTSLYRSVDDGHTFVSYKGAPGGDDNHALWIDPTDPSRMIMASDQGATISMDTGKSWSSWYNQPTGQIYHMSTDSRFPYWVYGTQQDSGSVGVLSRGDYGAITFLDWDPVAAYEFGYIIPSPIDPTMIYAGGPGRGLVLVNRSNRQVETISPNLSRDGDYRLAQNPPLAFSPQDPHVFYEGTQFLLETSDAGKNWKKISPDLTARPGDEAVNQTEKQEAAAATAQPPKARTREATETLTPPNRNAINSFSPSPVTAGEIWVGTTNGLIQLTKDGGATWTPVTPPGISPFAQISMLEASHFSGATAYASIDAHEVNDFKPHIYRTRDSGKTWQEADAGIPDGDFVRVVREDPKRKGLLYAGAENAAFVSFDDGDHWTSLQLNMPTTSVRDLQVHGSDLVAATYGRAFWILDDLAPLRQIASETALPPGARALDQNFLFRPDKALRVQLDLNGDTPLPPEMPAGENPPDGALIDYNLDRAPSSDITLEIHDQAGNLIRKFTSAPGERSVEPPPNVPDYWLGHPEPLTTHTGMNRFLWDLRYSPPSALRHNYGISAMYGATPAEPQGALVVPGRYEVALTVDGKTYRQPLEVTLDPRVSAAQAELEQQFALEQKTTAMVTATFNSYHQALVLREALQGDQKKLQNQDAASVGALKDFDKKVVDIQGEERGFGGRPGGKPKPTFALLNGELGSLATVIDSADTGPTPAMNGTFHDYCSDLTTLTTAWNDLVTSDLPALNQKLASQQLSQLPAAKIDPPSCE
ncbi:MAG TPA: glycoside hydrolase [Acidobacteriaceae bacterium]|nr:glycoside hydrolase [Acidobacteriaceae bacterium]